MYFNSIYVSQYRIMQTSWVFFAQRTTYNCTMYLLGIMKNWKFPTKNITLKPSLHDSLAALVRHSQAQKCIQTNPKPFQKVMEFKIFSEFYAD